MSQPGADIQICDNSHIRKFYPWSILRSPTVGNSVGCPCLDGSFGQDGVLWMNYSTFQLKVVLLCIWLSHAVWYLSTNTSALFCVSGSLMQFGTSLPTHLHCSVYLALPYSLVPLYQHICTVLCIWLSHAA